MAKDKAMHAVADTDRLVADGIITPEQAGEIEVRAREAMIGLAVNAVLVFGILAATGGLILWLASPLAVAIGGALALLCGLLVLLRGGTMLRMFGNAATLIGAGMLLGGGAVELLDKHPETAGGPMAVVGAVIAALAALALRRAGEAARFATAAILLMGLALHLGGLAYLMGRNEVSGLPITLYYLYTAALLAWGGWRIDLRLVTALAIVPFAQMLDTSTFYFHAAYVFYSPEPTLSILQMGLLIAGCLWLAGRAPERLARHARVLIMLAFVVANLCALVGSLWGDVVGEQIWGPGRYRFGEMSWEEFSAAREAFRASTLVISHHVFTVLWALALIAMLVWAGLRNQRGMFNAALTFAAIHAYTQLFESFYDEPLAYVIAGLTAIPLAWGTWRLNLWLRSRAAPSPLPPAAP
ncbi:hypothetical protein [Salipiger bermudensis]|uniref:hypothetical protein n=1 Tax=Salipiger bermudensis TaxID=344736 RepID=UPI0021BD767F|nr:hypothetical protein [Salipiger bermudensis]